MELLKHIFTWWNDRTIGTLLFTMRQGVLVGEDETGNKFYHSKDGKRRWVIFNGEVEASRISPDWHGWLHHTFAEPPTTDPLPHKSWEKPHLPNLTGGPHAYHPPGSILLPKSTPPKASYEPWQPE